MPTTQNSSELLVSIIRGMVTDRDSVTTMKDLAELVLSNIRKRPSAAQSLYLQGMECKFYLMLARIQRATVPRSSSHWLKRFCVKGTTGTPRYNEIHSSSDLNTDALVARRRYGLVLASDLTGRGKSNKLYATMEATGIPIVN